MKLSRLSMLLVSASCLPVAGALAQDNGEPVFLGTIRIETPDAQALLGNDEITEEEIEQRNPQTIRDVFSGESSITTSGGAAIGTKVFVNGIEESLLSVTIDGARQNKSAFHHTGNVLLDPALLKSVEVSEGLAPADAGPGALAGSLAYETKDARDLLDEGDDFGGILSFSAGTNDDALRSTLSLFGRTGGFEFVLSATRSASDDYQDGAGVTVPGTEADLTNYIAKVAYTSQSGHRLEFAASQTEDTGTRAGQPGPGGIIFLRPDFLGVVGVNSQFEEGLSRRKSFTATYTRENAEDWYDPTFQLSYNEQVIDVSGVYGKNESFSGTFKNRFQLGNGTLTAGLDFFDEKASGFGRGPGPFGSSGSEDMQNIGIFAQFRQDLDERVSVSYGARYDWQDFDAADGSSFSDDGFSANGSIDVILNDYFTVNAGYASSWGGYELGEAALVNFGAPWTYAGFTTSRANAGRIGLRFEHGPWQASGALFHTEVDDINAVLPAGGDRGARSDLVSRGFDGAVAYQGANGFAKLNYTYADVELDNATIGSTAYYLGRPVGHIVALETGWRINDQWGIGGTAEIAFDNDDAAIKLPGYEVFNAYATYRPKQLENLELRLDVRNLFDEDYSSRSSDGIDSTRVIPLKEPGRTFSLTASLKF